MRYAEAVIVLYAFLIGLCFGSFGNVLVYRLPQQRSILGRSMCIACTRMLRWFELFPVLSYALQWGKCRTCEAKISLQYPIIELLSGVLFALAVSHVVSPLLGFLTAFCLWFLLMIAIIDAKTSMIPDALNIPFFLLALSTSIFRDGFFLLPLVIGGGVFLFQWMVSGGRAIGSGDIILGAGIGALLGSVPLVLLWLIISYIVGSLFALLLLALKRTTLRSVMPFAPFLAGSAMLVQLYGGVILKSAGL